VSWESQGIALLTASLVRPFGLAAAGWLILRVLRVRHPASRHAVWTAVLIGMMLLPVVSVMAPHWKLAALPRASKHDSAAQAVASEPAFTGFDLPAVDAGQRLAEDLAETGQRQARRPVVQVYLAGLLAMVTYRVVGWALLWRVISRSRPLRERLRESSDVLTPVAVGVLRPVVILPAGWRAWNSNTKRAVLAHEFAHLRRHDTLVSALARLVQCVFWFHPLAWWLSRKISNLAELACDAAVLERVDDPVRYSRILLEFAGAVNRAAVLAVAWRCRDWRWRPVPGWAGASIRCSSYRGASLPGRCGSYRGRESY
jgi:beta-lactamase regulating signal transducer with metallopeptidase domain